MLTSLTGNLFYLFLVLLVFALYIMQLCYLVSIHVGLLCHLGEMIILSMIDII